MEKKQLLEPCLKAVALTLAFLALASCALPRFVVLRDPLTPEEHVNLGVSYEKKGELDAALKEYLSATKKMPLAYLYAGNVYFQQGRFPEAEKAYKKAVKKTGSPQSHNNLAWLYYTTDTRLEEAERLAEKAVVLSPQSDSFKDTLEKIREKRKPAGSGDSEPGTQGPLGPRLSPE